MKSNYVFKSLLIAFLMFSVNIVNAQDKEVYTGAETISVTLVGVTDPIKDIPIPDEKSQQSDDYDVPNKFSKEEGKCEYYHLQEAR